MDSRESKPWPSSTPSKQMDQESIIADSNISRLREEETPAGMKLHNAELVGARINQTTRRLVVKSITLDNFKSYQGRQTIGPFHNKFVSVIGANGSGKSNLLESLLFIFGHRASKMRLKQLKELIHNSYNYPNIEKATVTVHFNELEETLDGEVKTVVDSFSISRNIFAKDSGSNYEVNQKASSRHEVVELLKSKGMDMNNNRFLILQGEVEQISLMKPMSGKKEDPGLLEYLEDIIGSHAYVDQINQLELDYAEAKREKENRLLLVHDVRKELDSMESNKQKAIEFMEAEQRGLCLNHIFHNLKIFDTRDRENIIQSSLSKWNQTKETLREELKTIIGQWQGEFKALKELERHISLKNEEIELLKQKMDDNTKADNEVTLRIKSMYTQSSEASSQIEKNKADIDRRTQEVSKMRQDLPANESSLEKLQQELKQYTEALTAMMARIQPEIKKFNEKIQEIQEKISPIEREMKTQESQKRTLVKTLEDLDEKAIRMNTEKERLQSQIQENATRMETLQAKRMQTEHEMKSRRDKLHSCKLVLEEIEQNCRKSGDSLRVVEGKLHERNTHQEQAMSQNHVLTYLLASPDIKKFGKIYGRIGDLGRIDPDYDIAISAVGNQFNNILVESNITAKECVNLLKKDRVGSASFTALNKQLEKKGAMLRPFQAPKDSLRLFDLVQTKDEEVRVAYYAILQDTLVCRDIETAQRVAFGSGNDRRYRVVTMEGFIINPDGSMSGGGRPKRGLVGSTAQGPATAAYQDPNLPKESVQELLREKDRLRGLIENLTKEQYLIQGEVSKLNAELQRAPQLMREIEQDINNAMKENAPLLARLDSVSTELAKGTLGDEKKQILKEIDAIEVKFRKSTDTLEALQRQRSIQQEKVDQVGGAELKSIRETQAQTKIMYQKMEESTERIRAEIRKSEETIQNRLKENKELQEKLVTLEKLTAIQREEKQVREAQYLVDMTKKTEMEQEIAAMSQRQKQLADSAHLWMKNTQRIKEQLEEVNKSIDTEQKSLEIIKAEFGKIREDLEANRKKFLEFVDTFSLIEELKRMDRKDLGTGDHPDDFDDDEDIDDESRSQIVRRPKTQQRSAMKRKDLAPSGKKRKELVGVSNITPDREVSREELEELGLDLEKVRTEITMLKNMKMNLNTDTEVIQIFQDRLKDYRAKSGELSRVTEKEINLRTELTKLKDRRRVEFMTGFSFIAKTLKQVYQTITQGGDADLEPIDNSDPFASGISFNVRPPQKSWKQMSKLSGGEKTLSSLSLIFALHYYKPTPIYFMDEIDAALDFRNVEIVAKFIKERTKDAQFIVISLRNHMFELASQLIGIYKTQDTTKTISIYPLPIIEAVNEEMRRELAEFKASQSQGQLAARLSRRSLGMEGEASALKSKGIAQSLRTRLSVTQGGTGPNSALQPRHSGSTQIEQASSSIPPGAFGGLEPPSFSRTTRPSD